MPFAAFDLHKQEVEAVILNDDGTIRLRHRFPTTRAALVKFAQQHLGPGIAVAVEATFNTWPVVDVLTPLVKEVVVSNPLRTRAIADAKIKTDKVDALVLAQLLRLDFLPRVWIPDPATQQQRRATTERAQLTSDRTRLKNRIHAILHQRLIEAPAGDLFTPANLAWLRALPLDDFGRAVLDRHLRLLDQLELELTAVGDALAAHAQQSPQVKLLMTLPGVDFAVAETVLAALGDINRFSSPDRAAAYLGLVPSTRQSGAHCYHGPITKQGASHARWMLIQAAQHLGMNPGPIGVFFRKLTKRKKNRNIAVVATARKLVTIAWHMLHNNEPYRYSIPKSTQAKLDRLRIRATGERKKGGNPKGQPRPATYGSGQPTRAIPSLDRVLATNSLPPLAPLKPGETKMLERNELTNFEADLHQGRRVPKTVRPKLKLTSE